MYVLSKNKAVPVFVSAYISYVMYTHGEHEFRLLQEYESQDNIYTLSISVPLSMYVENFDLGWLTDTATTTCSVVDVF